MKLPKEIFVRVEKDSDGEEYLLDYFTEQEAIDGDGPTEVGTYQLVSKRRLRKVAEIVEA